MGKKKVKPSAFSAFMDEYIKKEERAGRRCDKVNICSGQSKNLNCAKNFINFWFNLETSGRHCETTFWSKLNSFSTIQQFFCCIGIVFKLQLIFDINCRNSLPVKKRNTKKWLNKCRTQRLMCHQNLHRKVSELKTSNEESKNLMRKGDSWNERLITWSRMLFWITVSSQ